MSYCTPGVDYTRFLLTYVFFENTLAGLNLKLKFIIKSKYLVNDAHNILNR